MAQVQASRLSDNGLGQLFRLLRLARRLLELWNPATASGRPPRTETVRPGETRCRHRIHSTKPYRPRPLHDLAMASFAPLQGPWASRPELTRSNTELSAMLVNANGVLVPREVTARCLPRLLNQVEDVEKEICHLVRIGYAPPGRKHREWSASSTA